jgi:hypothetical protein
MPKFSFPHNLDAPALPDVCEIAVFPVAVVPYALAALESRATEYTWAPESYLRGVQLIRSLQMALLCGGLKEITDRQDSLYRLLSGAIYGTEYSVVSTDPDLVIEPPIQNYHSLDFENPNSIIGRMEDMRQLQQNALNGTETSLYAEPLGVRALLANLITAVEAGGASDADMLAELVQIAGLLA